MELTDRQQCQEERYVFPYHYLDLRSDEYRLILHVEYVSRLRIVKELLRPFEGQAVLDAGCGDGRLCYELKDENLQLTGVDYSEQALAFARAFCPSVEFIAQDLRYLSLPDTFDQVVLMEVLEHFIPEDIPLILKNLANVLCPGGTLIVTVPSVKIPTVNKHYQHFTVETLAHTLEEFFTVEKCLGTSKVEGVGLLTRLFYWRSKRVCTWLYPFRDRRWIYRIIKAYKQYYERKLATGRPKECTGLVAVCCRK